MRTLHLTIAITSAAALQPPTIQRRPRTVRQSQESPYVADYDQPPGPHATKWLATSENNDQWIEFDERHYRSMYADMSRTEMFTQTLEKKLSKFPPKTAVVCDLGTGPYLLFAKAAAAAGARKVYAIEAVPGSQNKAREELAQLEAADNSGVEPGVIELVCGFSTDVELPEKVDILISEIAGSIASEEGVYGVHAASLAFNSRRWRHSRPPRSHDKRREGTLCERTKKPRLLRALLLRDLGRAGHGFVPPFRRVPILAERRHCPQNRLARQLHAVAGRSCISGGHPVRGGLAGAHAGGFV